MAGIDPVLDSNQVLASNWEPGLFPVDPVLVARSLGINVVDATMPDNVSGAIIKKPEQDAQILLNASDSFKRKRFTCAHEIGHFIRHLDSPDAFEYLDYRNLLSGQGADADEIYANKFAANLLMPEDAVRKMRDAGKGLIELMAYFGVSQDAMRYRLINLQLI